MPPKVLLLAVIGFMLLSQSCALSPQSVVLRPTLDVSIPALSQTQTVALKVLDLRATEAFGMRGGIYNTALITPRTDLAETLRRVLAERLQHGNFQVIEMIEANSPPLSLEVRIKRIDYGVTSVLAGGLLNEVRVNAMFQATARSTQNTLSGQYQATGTRQINGYLSAQQNEALLNKVVGQALQSMLADQELLAVLRG